MLLRTRIVAIFGLALVALLGAVAGPLLIVERLTADSLARAREETEAAAWDGTLSDIITPYEILSARIAADPALRAAIDRNDAAEARQLLAKARADSDAVRIDVLTSEGRVFASSAGMAAETPLLDATWLASRIQDDPYVTGIEAGSDGALLMVVTSAIGNGFLSVAASPEPALRAFGRGDRMVFVLDQMGRLAKISPSEAWPELAAALARTGNRTTSLERDGRTLTVVSTPLLTTSMLPIGTLVTVRDTTPAAQRRALVLLITVSAAGLVFAVLLIVLFASTKAALGPLSDITRVIRGMAAGDAMVSADIPDRHDEVGEIAAAVEVFRRDIVALAQTRVSDRLWRAQQQALIRREMETLAGVLEDSERDDLRRDLQEIEAASAEGEAALAEGFRRMAARVMAQHVRLADLLAERTRDLEVVREALAERAQLTRLRQEMEVARALQLGSLPQVFPPFPERTDFEIHAAMEPAREVGGDFYDFALLDDDRLAVMIGDASGKGVSAAMFIAMGRSILRSAIVRGATPAQALGLANATMAVENHTMMFATAFVGVLDLNSGRLTFACAGHNPPYLVDKAGKVDVLPSGGIALGVIDDATYQDRELTVPCGASLVMFTDGVTEANTPEMELYGEARLEHLLTELAATGPEGTVVGIQQAIRSFAGTAEQADDITVLSVRWLGPGVNGAGPGGAGRAIASARVPAAGTF